MFSLIHAQGSTNQANLIGLQHQVPWFSFLLFLINAVHGLRNFCTENFMERLEN